MRLAMKCPSCGARHPIGVHYCEECRESLGAAAGPEGNGGEPADHELVAVHRTTDVTEVPVIRSLLQAEGISCVVRGEQALLMDRFVQALGWGRGESAAEVLVPSARAAEASDLLRGEWESGPE
jgi:hypothetical protein